MLGHTTKEYNLREIIEEIRREDEFQEYNLIPDRTLATLINWARQGIRPGGFLTAVLTNDLQGAVARADLENQRALVQIAKFVHHKLPSRCHTGSQAYLRGTDVLSEWKGTENE